MLTYKCIHDSPKLNDSCLAQLYIREHFSGFYSEGQHLMPLCTRCWLDASLSLSLSARRDPARCRCFVKPGADFRNTELRDNRRGNHIKKNEKKVCYFNVVFPWKPEWKDSNSERGLHSQSVQVCVKSVRASDSHSVM